MAGTGPIDVRLRVDPAALALAATLMLAALAIPPRAVARVLVAPEETRYAAVVLGVWLFKGLLGVHALIALLARPLLATPAEPLERVAPPMARPASHLPALLAVMMVATIVRAVHLGDGLWLDEITTLLAYVRRPITETLTLFESKNNHVLFSLLARGSVRLFGDVAWALRLPALVFGVLSLPALYWFGSMIVSRREAMFATAIMALSYHHVWFSQNARGYTGLLLFTILGTGFFLKLLSRSRAGTGALVLGYAAAMAAAAYTHLTAGLVVIAHALVLAVVLAARRDRRSWAAARPAILALLLAGTFSLQLYAIVLPQVMGALFPPVSRAAAMVRSGWRNPLWMFTETLLGLRRGLPGGWVALAFGMLITVLGTARLWRRSAVAAGLIFVPVLVTAAALLAAAHQLWPRFFFFAAGFGILIATAGVQAGADTIGRRRAPVFASVALGLVLLLSAVVLPRAWGPKQDFEGAAAFIEGSRGAADAVVTYGPKGRPFQLYLGKDWFAPMNAQALERVEATHQRTWVVYTVPASFERRQPSVWRRLQREYRLVARFPGTLGGGTIYVLVKE